MIAAAYGCDYLGQPSSYDPPFCYSYWHAAEVGMGDSKHDYGASGNEHHGTAGVHGEGLCTAAVDAVGV